MCMYIYSKSLYRGYVCRKHNVNLKKLKWNWNTFYYTLYYNVFMPIILICICVTYSTITWYKLYDVIIILIHY